MRLLVILPIFLIAGCAGLSGIPSLAPRPAESAAGVAPVAPGPIVQTAAPPALVAQLKALSTAVQSGDTQFTREDRAGAAAILAGRRAAAGSEAWIAGETARSALEAARQQSSDALAQLDGLLVEATAGGGGGLAEITAAKDAAEAIVARQSERLAALTR